MDQDSTKPSDYRQDIIESYLAYRWVWRSLLENTGRVAAQKLVACLCISHFIAMTIPWLLGRTLQALQQRNEHDVKTYGIAITFVLLFRLGIQYLENRQREITFGANQGSIDLETNRLFSEKSLGQHLKEHDLLSTAGMEKGRTRAQETIMLLLTEGSETFFLLLSSYLAIWFLSWFAGIICTLLFLMYGLWSWYLNTRVAEVCAPLDEQFRAWNRYLKERQEKITHVKINGKEKEEDVHLTTTWQRILKLDQTFWLWFSDQCVLRGLASTCAFVGVMGYSVWQVWCGNMAFGMILPLFIWMRNILENIWRLGSIEHRVSWNLPSVQSLKRALTMQPDVVDVPNAKIINVTNGVKIEFCGVGHQYANSKHDKQRISNPQAVLRDVSFTVEPGEVVALLGRSGAGKSTIMRLLQRGMDPEQGSIRINGTDLREVQLHSWLRCLGNIPQQAAVFDGTIRSNLLYGLDPHQRENVSDDELWTLMRELKIDFGERLEEGLDTRVGRSGIKLSGGEAQRLMIGAAVAKKPHFMLIDEATSALDSTTERAVQAGLAQALRGNTGALIIAHRLDTIRSICTKFVVLRAVDELNEDESQIEAIANTFEELARVSPTFRRLASDQGIVL